MKILTITLTAAIAWMAGMTARQHISTREIHLLTTTTTWAGGRMTVESYFDGPSLTIQRRVTNIEQAPDAEVRQGVVPREWVPAAFLQESW